MTTGGTWEGPTPSPSSTPNKGTHKHTTGGTTMKRKVLNGYYYTTAYYDEPLALQPYAQAGVRYFAVPSSLNPDNYDRLNVVQLVSYVTPILEYYRDTHELYILYNPSCSATTRKHVGSFLKQFVRDVTYADVRDVFKAYWADDDITRYEKMVGETNIIVTADLV